MIKELFKFPIIMIDGNIEEKKQKDSEMLGLSLGEPEPDIIYGEAECPYYDFLSISDRWLPTDESFDKAKNGEFDACNVVFLNSGGYIVPMSKEEFKEKLNKFIDSISEPAVKETKKGKSKVSTDVKILRLSEKDLLDMLGKKLEQEDEGEQSEQ
jgi:hypothetical protein